jgi:non-lysosomal glucosylceramidase
VSQEESKRSRSSRRSFLSNSAAATALSLGRSQPQSEQEAVGDSQHSRKAARAIGYPRIFTREHLTRIAFPLGGVCAGSVSLGGRGQLRDWEIFNKPDKGNQLSYALPSIWAQVDGSRPVAHVLEARYEPPYEGQNGLGSQNAPGLSRLAAARFTGEYPFARIDFEDDSLPVRASLEAFTPVIPHDPDDSGLPIAVLRYHVSNSNARAARVSIAWSIDNPVVAPERAQSQAAEADTRVNAYQASGTVSGLVMTNPGLSRTDVYYGSFVLAVLSQRDGKLTYLQGWPKGRWWNSPLLFWDDFSQDGQLGPEAKATNSVGAICLSRSIPAGGSDSYEFLLAWHFPNRTPAHCGWSAPAGDENVIIGNWYSTRFPDAWAAAQHAASHLPRLEARTRLFASRCRARGGVRKFIYTCNHHLFPNLRWRVSWLRGGE